MREAISKVKDRVAKKDIIPLLTHYIVKSGRVFACNDIVTTSVPIEIDFDMCVRAAEFQKFLDKTDGDIKVAQLENNWLKVSCGRFRAQIPSMDPALAPTWEPSKGKPLKLPPEFKARLEALRPFVSDNATQPFASNICINDGYMYATNNIVLARSKVDLKCDELMFNYDTLDYILSRDDDPTYLMYDESSLTFGWKDKTWLHQRSQAVKFPAAAFKFLDTIPKAKWKVTDDWREAVQQLGELITGEVVIFADKMVSSQPTAVVEVDIKSPVPEGHDHTSWNSAFVAPVLEHASHLTIYFDGGPRMSFRNEHIDGICSGMRK